MYRDFSEINSTNLKALHQLPAEVQSRGWSRHGTFIGGIDGLEMLHIVGSHLTTIDDIAWQWGRTQCKELSFKLIVRTIIQKAQGTSATGGIIDDLSYHWAVVLEEEFIAYAYLAGWFDQDIPQSEFLIKLTQQEHLDLGIGLLLSTKETGRKDLGTKTSSSSK